MDEAGKRRAQARRTASVARAFDRSWSSILASPGWWPATPQVGCTRLLREAADPAAVVTSPDFMTHLGRSLRQWRAFRGARFDERRLRRSLDRVAPLLGRWVGTSLLRLRGEGGHDLFELFDAVGDVKLTERRWVATSKLLYHLLPDLVVPMDNLATAPFLGRSQLPVAFDAAFVEETYAAFAELASSVGAARVRKAANAVPFPVPGAARQDCRIGMARVVDFAIAGYVRDQGRAALHRRKHSKAKR